MNIIFIGPCGILRNIKRGERCKRWKGLLRPAPFFISLLERTVGAPFLVYMFTRSVGAQFLFSMFTRSVLGLISSLYVN